MRRRTMLGAVALGVAGAAVAGYGAAMGRDAWKATRRNAGLLLFLALIACAIVMPFLGGRNLTRGYPEGQRPPVFTSMLLILGGAAMGLAATGIMSLYGVLLNHVLVVGGVAALSMSFGLVWGSVQKPRRLHTFAIAEHNEEFLDSFGFEEVNEKEVSHIDGEGNPLRLTERNADSIVFLAVGRRNRRAYIGLSPEGRMLGYTGVIAVTDPRRYHDPFGQSISV